MRGWKERKRKTKNEKDADNTFKVTKETYSIPLT